MIKVKSHKRVRKNGVSVVRQHMKKGNKKSLTLNDHMKIYASSETVPADTLEALKKAGRLNANGMMLKKEHWSKRSALLEKKNEISMRKRGKPYNKLNASKKMDIDKKFATGG